MWKYQELLNTDLSILLTIALGLISVVKQYVFRRGESATLNKLIFKFLLPASVIQGLGLKTDLYDEDIWRFVGAFLVMRGIMLVACILFFGAARRQSLGEVASSWMSTTWISTVILGTPILKALFGPSYTNLGVVAGISSWIFQLPVMLLLFEVHSWRQANLHDKLPETDPAAAGGGRDGANSSQLHSSSVDSELVKEQAANAACLDSPRDYPPQAATSFHGYWGELRHFRLSRAQLKSIGLRLLNNHVLWACLIGTVLSLSKIGPKWLNPGNLPTCPNPTYAVGAGFIAALLDYFARCTEPIALFSTGMWMHQKNPLGCGLLQAALYMLVKLVAVPALMVGCAFMVGLDGAYGRAAVLLATLPVSAAAFALSKSYNVGEDVAVANVVIGNLLILPTTIAWVSFMDAVDLFGVPGPVKGNPCTLPVP